jgi:hypothetical protein
MYRLTKDRYIYIYQRLTVLQKLNTASYRVPLRFLLYRTVPCRVITFIYRTVSLPRKVHGIPSREIPYR